MWRGRRDTAKHFGVGIKTIDKFRRAGMPHSIAPTGRVLIELEAADQWLRDRASPVNNLIDELLASL